MPNDAGLTSAFSTLPNSSTSSPPETNPPEIYPFLFSLESLVVRFQNPLTPSSPAFGPLRYLTLMFFFFICYIFIVCTDEI